MNDSNKEPTVAFHPISLLHNFEEITFEEVQQSRGESPSPSFFCEKMTSTMDVDFWSSSLVPSAKHDQPSLLDQDNHLVLEDSEGEDDDKAFFPCPFCYVEIDVNVLCRHLQNEHCTDLKNAVCPLCAGNLGKEPTGHFVEQHSSSLKRKKRSHKSIFWSSNSASLGNELTSFLGSMANVRGNTSDPMSHPVLSPFLHSTPEHCQQDEASKASLSSAPDAEGSSSVDEDIKVDYETKMQRERFVQQLIASTIF